MIEAINKSKDVGQILKPSTYQYQSGHVWKEPSKQSSIYSVVREQKKIGR